MWHRQPVPSHGFAEGGIDPLVVQQVVPFINKFHLTPIRVMAKNRKNTFNPQSLKAFAEKHGLSRNATLKYSNNKTYQGSETPIAFLRLNEEIEETEQTFLVCSRGLAEALISEELTIKDAMVVKSDYGYGLVRPDSCKGVDVELW